MGYNKRGFRGQPVRSWRKERARDWLYEVEVTENNRQFPSASEEEDYSELSELSSDYDIIQGITERQGEVIDSEIEESIGEVIKVAVRRVMRSRRII